MSKEVDQRIVEMQFNNADFEQKVSKSISSLKQLKDASQMEDAGKGLDNLTKGIHHLDLSHIADGIDKLNSRFSNLGIVGMTVMQNLTNAAMGLGKQLMDTLTEAPRGGMQTYESFISATKQLKNSAKDAEGLPVTLDAVNKALDELNNYSDKTIYSFNDMTANIGKFTNAGVSLEDSVTAIKGISNVAASAGANAQNAAAAMYNFGQALGTGVVKLVDWKSINNANMGTIEFKEQLIQTAKELGTLKEVGDRYIATTYSGKKATEEAFNASSKFEDSLQQQWMTSEVLIKTLEKYADDSGPYDSIGNKAYRAATEVNSFTQMMSVFAESQKTSWSKTWRYIFGDYEESKQLWTSILGGLNWMMDGFNHWRNEFFKTWHDLGGRSELVSAFGNIWATVKFYVEKIGGAFKPVFSTIDATPLVKIAEGFNAVTEKIRPVKEEVEKVTDKVEETAEAVSDVAERAEKFNEIVQQIIRGEWGNGQERIDRLHEAGYAFENLQNAVNELLGCEKRYETVMSDNEAVGIKAGDVLKENAELATDQANAVDKLTESTEEAGGVIGNLVKILLAVKSTTALIGKGFGAVWSALGKGAFILDTLKAGFKFILDILGAVAGKVYGFTSWLSSFNSLGAIFSGLRAKVNEFALTFSEFGLNLNKITPFLYKLESVIKKLKDKFIELIAPLKNFTPSVVFDTLLTVLKSIAYVVGGVLFVSVNALASVLSAAYDYAVAFWDTIKNLSLIKAAAEAFKNFKEDLKGFKKEVSETGIVVKVLQPAIKAVSDAFTTFGKIVGPFVGWALDYLTLNAVRAINAIEHLINEAKKTEAWGAFVDMMQKLKLAFNDIPDAIAKVYDSLRTTGKLPALTELPNSVQFLIVSFNRFKDVISGNFTALLQDVFSKIVETFGKLNELNFGPFQGFVDSLRSIFDDLKKIVIDGEGTVGQFLQNVWGKISKIDFRGGAITALIGAAALFAARWSKIGKSASKALDGLALFFRNGGKVAVTAVDKFNGFLKIAAAIGILAGAIWLISTIPAERFKRSVATIGIAFIAMFGVIELMAKQQIPEEKMKSIGLAFAGFGASFLLIAAAAKIFASMKPEEMKKAGIAMAAFTVGIVAASLAAKGVGQGAGAAFVGIAAALLILIPAIKMYAAMDATTLVRGGMAIATFMTMIALASRIAGEGGKGLIGMAAALAVLAISVKLYAAMDPDDLVKGGVAIFAFMTMLAAAMRLAGNASASGFVGMAIAIGVLTASLVILTKLDFKALLAAAASLSMVLLSLSTSLNTLSGVSFGSILKSVIAMIAVLTVIGGAMYLLTKYTDSDKVLKSALGISALIFAFGAMGPGIQALSKIPFKEGVVAAGNAIVFFGAMVLCLGALGEVASFGDGAVGAAIENGANVLGNLIGNFVNGLIHGLSGDVSSASEKTVTLADNLSAFGRSIQGFLMVLKFTDGDVVQKASDLAMAIMAIAGANLLDAVAGFIRGKADLEGFSNAIVPLTQAVVQMNKELEGVSLDADKIGTVTDIVTSMSDLAKSLPKKGGWAQKILGVQELSTFAADMKDFLSNGFRSFVIGINHLGNFLGFDLIPKISVLKNATSAMIDLAKALPANGVISNFIDGPKDLGKFAANMCSFMADEGGFQDFAEAVNNMTTGINLEMLKGNIIPATEEMIKLGTKLKEGSSIIDFITGRTDLGKFGTTLADFGKGINDFSTSIVNVKLDHVNGMTDAMERLADLNASEQLKSSNLGTFSSSINALGAAIAQFYTDSGAADPAQLGTIIGQITNLHNLLLILSGSDYSGISNFAEALEKLGQASAQSFIDSFTESATEATEAATTFVNSFLTTIETLKGEFKKKGATVVLEFCVGINSNEGFLNGAGKSFVTKVGKGVDEKKKDNQAIGKRVVLEFCSGVNDMDGFLNGAGIHMVTKAIGGIKSEIDQFFKQGQYSAEGYADGIRDMASEAADEAARMVRNAAEAARREQDSASPSKVYKGFGKDAVDGYILGFVNNTYKVIRAAKSMAKAGINTMQDAVDKTRSLIDGSMDYVPTITPVMDLSELSSGVQQANMLLSDIHTDDLAATTAASIANAHNEAIAVKTAQPANYSRDIAELIDNTSKIINAVKQNRYAIIDGDEAFRYFDRRLGMA